MTSKLNVEGIHGLESTQTADCVLDVAGSKIKNILLPNAKLILTKVKINAQRLVPSSQHFIISITTNNSFFFWLSRHVSCTVWNLSHKVYYTVRVCVSLSLYIYIYTWVFLMVLAFTDTKYFTLNFVYHQHNSFCVFYLKCTFVFLRFQLCTFAWSVEICIFGKTEILHSFDLT